MTSSQSSSAGSTRRRLQSEDLLALAVIPDARIAPDGRSVAYVVKQAHLEPNEYRSAIHLATLDDDGRIASSRQLTAGSHRDSAPRWSPDGRQLAFISDRSGTAQLYVIDMAGGEPRQLTELDRGVSAPTWSPDSTRLAFVSSQGNGIDDDVRDQPGGMIRRLTRRIYRFDAMGYIDDRFGHIWVIDAAGGDPRQVSRGQQSDSSPAWSPDGTRLAFVSNREPDVSAVLHEQVYVVAADGSSARGDDDDGGVLVSRGTRQASAPAWSPDGSEIAYIGQQPDAPAGANAAIYLAGTRSGDQADATRLTSEFDRSPGVGLYSDTWSPDEAATLFWTPDGSAVVFTACDKGRVSAFRADRSGKVALVIGGDRAVGCVSSTAEGQRLAFIAGDFTNPCDVYLCDADGANERRLTSLNAELLAQLAIQTPEHMPFASFDRDFEVDAWLIRPVDYEPGKRYPLVQLIHGGPHSVFGHTFFFDMQLWASQGYNVLFVNPRATQGYGEAFATACLDDWGGADWREQEMALDLAIERGGVDPERLAVTGLSYGGYMTDWIVGQTDRYRAAVSENGICNLVSFAGTSDIGWSWLQQEWGNRPVWDNIDYYMAHSPLSYVSRVKTPTLLLQSEADWRCPIEQGEQFYEALLSVGVPTEMIRFPGESHGNLRAGKPRSRLERRNHTLRWFAQYL